MTQDMRSEPTANAAERIPLDVGAFLEDWLESIAYSIRPRTLERYQEYVRLHAIPTIGALELRALEPRDLQLLYSRRIEAGLSLMSVLHLHRVLHRALHGWFVLRHRYCELLGCELVERARSG